MPLNVDGTTERIFAQIVRSLRCERERRGLSQDELASRLPVRGRAVSEWEIGAVVPTLGHLFLWNRLLGLRLIIMGPDGGVCDVPLDRCPGESWEMFEQRRLVLPLRIRREALGLSRAEVGRLVGVSLDSVQRWEFVRVPLRPMALIVWARKLGYSVTLRPVSPKGVHAVSAG